MNCLGLNIDGSGRTRDSEGTGLQRVLSEGWVASLDRVEPHIILLAEATLDNHVLGELLRKNASGLLPDAKPCTMSRSGGVAPLPLVGVEGSPCRVLALRLWLQGSE